MQIVMSSWHEQQSLTYVSYVCFSQHHQAMNNSDTVYLERASNSIVLRDWPPPPTSDPITSPDPCASDQLVMEGPTTPS